MRWSIGSPNFPVDWILSSEASDTVIIIPFFEVLQVGFCVELFIGEEVLVRISSLNPFYPLGRDLIRVTLTEWEIVGSLEYESGRGEIERGGIQMIGDMIDELVIIRRLGSIIRLRLEGGNPLISEHNVGKGGRESNRYTLYRREIVADDDGIRSSDTPGICDILS